MEVDGSGNGKKGRYCLHGYYSYGSVRCPREGGAEQSYAFFSTARLFRAA